MKKNNWTDIRACHDLQMAAPQLPADIVTLQAQTGYAQSTVAGYFVRR